MPRLESLTTKVAAIRTASASVSSLAETIQSAAQKIDRVTTRMIDHDFVKHEATLGLLAADGFLAPREEDTLGSIYAEQTYRACKALAAVSAAVSALSAATTALDDADRMITALAVQTSSAAKASKVDLENARKPR